MVRRRGSDFTPGSSMVMLPTSVGLISTAICYEIVYPGLVRASVLAGSRLLTTITNDAWYGYSSAPYQHFAQAAMRAIENGRYLVRAANTGISALIHPFGRILARTGIGREKVRAVPLLERFARKLPPFVVEAAHEHG